MPPMIPTKDLEKTKGFFKRLKEDVMKNARSKLKLWEVKKMPKKEIDEIPDIKDREAADSGEPTEPKDPTEEPQVQLVTNEQLIQYRLDTLTLNVQDLNTKLQELIEVLRKKK